MVVSAKQRIDVEELPIKFDADCPAAVALDDLVYVTGPSVGGVAQVDKVDITDVSTMPAIGVVSEKATATRCTVVTVGEVSPIITLIPGKRYFVSSSGKPTELLPVPGTGTSLLLQTVGYALDTNRLLMNLNLGLIIRRG